MKKGRHRRFEEARAMKRDNRPDSEEDYAAWLNDKNNYARDSRDEDDPYADLAAKYNQDDEGDEDDDQEAAGGAGR